VVEDLSERLIDLLHPCQLDVVLLALQYDCGAVETMVLCEDRFVVALSRTHAELPYCEVESSESTHHSILGKYPSHAAFEAEAE
jgi:hypothetical protein